MYRRSPEAHLELDRDGQLQGVSVTADGVPIGRWKRGYADVSAFALEDKDDVRRAVQQAVGAHTIATLASP